LVESEAQMEAIIFDLDGVLVDVRFSYLATIKRVAEFFLKETVPLEKIQSFRNRGGLNNDWDLTLAILREENYPLDRETVISIFQTIYRGRNFDGLIQQERWLLKKRVLNQLHKNYRLAVVTGRPRDEAEFALCRFKAKEYFQCVVTRDDLPPELSKPHPAGLVKALTSLHVSHAWYVGDTVDDIQMAKAARIPAIGVVGTLSYPELQARILSRQGAWQVIYDVNSIGEVLQCKEQGKPD